MGWFFLKVTLIEPNIVARVSSCDTEKLWKVLGKSNYWFPIEPRKKSVTFILARQRVKISNFMGLVLLKGTLIEPKTVIRV